MSAPTRRPANPSRTRPNSGSGYNQAIRYERRADIREAFVNLGCALICLSQIGLPQ